MALPPVINGKLALVTAPTIPPKALAVGVTVNGEIVAWLTIEEVERAAAHIAKLKAALREREG